MSFIGNNTRALKDMLGTKWTAVIGWEKQKRSEGKLSSPTCHVMSHVGLFPLPFSDQNHDRPTSVPAWSTSVQKPDREGGTRDTTEPPRAYLCPPRPPPSIALIRPNDPRGSVQDDCVWIPQSA